MATAHFFTKTGTLLKSVTDGGVVVGWGCDYIGGGQFIMGSNTNIVNIGQFDANSITFIRQITVSNGAGTSRLRGVAMQRDEFMKSNNKCYVLHTATS